MIVFRYPGDAKMNYIKRLVGRPHETVRIRHGDIYIQHDEASASHSGTGAEAAEFDIARKPPDKVRAMSQVVYDNDYVVDAMTKVGWPLRWQSWSGSKVADADSAAAQAWQSADGGRSYHIDAGRRGLDPLPALHRLSRRLGRHSGRPRAGCASAAADYRFLRLQFRRTPRCQSARRHVRRSADGAQLGRRPGARRHDQCQQPAGRSAAGSGPRGPALSVCDRGGVGRGPAQDRRCAGSSAPGQNGVPRRGPAPGQLCQCRPATVSMGRRQPGDVRRRNRVSGRRRRHSHARRSGTGRHRLRGAAVDVEHLVLRRDVYYIAAKDSSDRISDYEPGARSGSI